MAAIGDDLRTAGEERLRALGRLYELNDRIASLALEAHRAGMAKKEIARLAGISRPTLDAFLKRADMQ